MSLDRYENKDDVLNPFPVWGDTVSDDIKSNVQSTTVDITEDDIFGNIEGNTFNTYKEIHLYSNGNLLKSDKLSIDYDIYGNTYPKIFVEPESDIRDLGFKQGIYSINYNFGTEFLNGLKIDAISGDRTEVILSGNADEIINFSFIHASSDFNTTFNTPNIKKDIVLNFGENDIYDIINIDFRGDKIGVITEYLAYPRSTYQTPDGGDVIPTVFVPFDRRLEQLDFWYPLIEVYNPAINDTENSNLRNKPTGREGLFILQKTDNGYLKFYGATDTNNIATNIDDYNDNTRVFLGHIKYSGGDAYKRQLDINDNGSIRIQSFGTTTTALGIEIPDIQTINEAKLQLSDYELGGLRRPLQPSLLPSSSLPISVSDENTVVIKENGNFYLQYSRFENRYASFDRIVVKLNRPLGANIGLNSKPNLDGRMMRSWIDKVLLIPQPTIKESDADFSEPDFNINVDGFNNGKSTVFKTWETLLDSNAITKNELVSKYFSGSFGDIKLNIDYSDFTNFVHFSSATERVNNFIYKLHQIENYNNRLSILSNVSGSDAISNISQSIVRRDMLIGTFDDFENWMYYSTDSNLYTHVSSSDYTLEPYPKISTFPHVIRPTTSNEGILWIRNTINSAKAYDDYNTSRLVNLIPMYIREDELNEDYLTFIDMIGQHFDISHLYIKSLTTINSREEHPSDGIPNELIRFVAESLGWKLSNGYNNTDLWNYTIGVQSDGTLLQTGSLSSKSKDTVVKETWRRIVNNIPLLYKSKGTARSIKALLSCYGIPQSFLQIKEFGGPTINSRKNVYEHERYVYKVRTSPSKYVTTPWDSIDGSLPSTIEVIAKPPKNNHHLFRMTGSGYVDYFWDYDSINELSRIRLSVDGSDYISSSYAPYLSERDVVFTLSSGSSEIKASWVDDFGNTLAFISASTSETNSGFDDIWGGFIGKDVLQIQGNTVNTTHYSQTPPVAFIESGSYITASVDYYIPSTNTAVSKVRLRSGNTDFQIDGDIIGEWAHISASYSPTVPNNIIRLQLLPSVGVPFDSNNESAYFKDLRIVSSSGDVLYTSSWYDGGDIFLTNDNQVTTSLYTQSLLDDYPTVIQFSGPTLNTTSSLQEVRYYKNKLTDTVLIEHSKNREAYFSDENITDLDVTGSFQNLKYRMVFDSLFPTVSSSLHPNQSIIQSDSGLDLTASYTNLTSTDLSGESDTYFMSIPSTGLLNLMNNKVRIESSSLVGNLNPDKSMERSQYDYAPLDSNIIGVYFSTVDSINRDIYNSEGYFEVDDWIGDTNKNNTNYELLRYKARDYFQKYTSNNIGLIFSLLSKYDLSVFNQIEQLLPARSVYKKGILLEPHILNRSKSTTKQENVSYTRKDYSALIPRLTLLNGSKSDYGLTTGSDGLIQMDLSSPTEYKKIGLTLSSSTYITSSNPYWVYSPTGSSVMNTKESLIYKKTNYFYSTDESASLNLPFSSSQSPARISDYTPISLENLKYSGCKVVSTQIGSGSVGSSDDTLDGLPGVIIGTVDSNELSNSDDLTNDSTLNTNSGLVVDVNLLYNGGGGF